MYNDRCWKSRMPARLASSVIQTVSFNAKIKPLGMPTKDADETPGSSLAALAGQLPRHECTFDEAHRLFDLRLELVLERIILERLLSDEPRELAPLRQSL